MVNIVQAPTTVNGMTTISFVGPTNNPQPSNIPDLPLSFFMYDGDGEVMLSRNTKELTEGDVFETVENYWVQDAIFDPEDCEDEESLEKCERNLHLIQRLQQMPDVEFSGALYWVDQEGDLQRRLSLIPKMRQELREDDNDTDAGGRCTGYLNKTVGTIDHDGFTACPIHG